MIDRLDPRAGKPLVVGLGQTEPRQRDITGNDHDPAGHPQHVHVQGLQILQQPARATLTESPRTRQRTVRPFASSSRSKNEPTKPVAPVSSTDVTCDTGMRGAKPWMSAASTLSSAS